MKALLIAALSALSIGSTHDSARCADPVAIKTIEAPFSVRHMEVSPDGNWVAAGFFRTQVPKWVGLWSVVDSKRNNTPIKILLTEPSYSLCFSPDSRLLAIGTESGFSIVETKTHQIIVNEKSRDCSATIQFFENGSKIMAGTSCLYLDVWNRQSDKQWILQKAELPKLACTCHLFSPDGKLELTAYGEEFGLVSKAGQIIVQDRGSKRELARIAAPEPAIRSLAFSPESRLLIIQYSEFCTTKASVIDIATGKVRWSLKVGKQSIEHVSVSNDLTLVAFGYYSGEIIICDGASGRILWHWKAHSDAVSGIRLMADKKGIVSSSFDGTIKFWSLPYAKSSKD